MRDEDRPFIAYRDGRWNIKIVPRNARGWRAAGLWMLLLVLLSGGFTALIVSDPENTTFTGWLTAGFLIVVVIWSVAMIRWMLARSEVIDLAEMRKLKRDQERSRKRQS